MAFRSRELSLVLRLQDRASSRLRRISSDIGGVNRAAQMQRNAARTAMSQERNLNQQAKLRQQIESRTSAEGERNLARQSQLLRLKANEATMWDRLGRAKSGSVREYALIKRIEATEKDMLRLRGIEKSEVSALNGELTKAVALQSKLAHEAQATATALNRARRVEGMQRAGRTSIHAGSVGILAGGITLAGLGATAGAYAKLNTETVRAATQTGRTGEDFRNTIARAKELESAILGLAQQFPATASEMAQSSYDIFSSMDLQDKQMQKNLGTTTELAAGTKLMTLANKVAVAGQTDLKSATNTMITVLNNFNPSGKNVNKTLNEMFAIVRFGRMDFAQFGDLMNSLAPAAKKADQSLTQVGAAAAQLTKFIPSQSQVGVSISRLLDIFTRKDFQQGMARVGKGFEITDSRGKLLPLYDIIGKIIKLNPQIQNGGAALNNLIQSITAYGRRSGMGIQSTQQARKALILLVTGYQQYGATLRHLKDDNNEFGKSFEALSKSPGVRWQVFTNQLRAMVLIIGEQVIPVFIKLGGWVQGVARRWQGLDPNVRHAIVTFTAFAAIAAIVVGVAASIVGSFLVLGAGFSNLAKRIGPAKGAGALGRTNALLTSLRALSFLARGGIVIAVTYLLIKKWSKNSRGDTFGSFDKKLNEWGHSGKGLKSWNPLKPLAVGVSSLDALMRGRDLKDPTNAVEKAARRKMIKAAEAIHDENPGNRFRINRAKQARNNALIYADKLDKINAFNDAQKDSDKKLAAWEKSLAKQKISAFNNALDEQTNNIKQYTDTLVSKFKELEDAAKSSFGELFQGPIAQGPLGQIYQKINDLVTGFGGKPIATPISLLNKDLKAQTQNFSILRNDYAKLLRKGAPKEFVQELQGQGMGAISQVEGLANANPAQLNAYIKMWQSKRAAIKTAANADMQMTLSIWKGYGKGIAWQIIQGLASDPAQATLREGFQKYIVSTFGSELSSSLSSSVAKAVSDWQKENAKPKAGKKQRPIPNSGAGVASHTIIYHGDTITVRSDETNAHAIKRYFDKRAFVNKHRGNP